MAEYKLPLLAHIGNEHTFQEIRKDLRSPKNLELPLKIGVNVIAAHCGAVCSYFDTDYFPMFKELLGKYDNLYGDLSAFNVPFRLKAIPECRNIASRLIHGSDFPIPVTGFWAWKNGLVDWKTFIKWQKSYNVIERDYQLKLAMGLEDCVFSNVFKLLRI